jgi:hypothetical protein
MPRTAKRIDEGLQQIEDWHAWFLSAHRQRIADLNLPPADRDRQLVDCIGIGNAVAERMKSDYLARTHRP